MGNLLITSRILTLQRKAKHLLTLKKAERHGQLDCTMQTISRLKRWNRNI